MIRVIVRRLKSIISVTFALLLFLAPSSQGAEFIHQWSVALGGGYRMDELDWNIAGNNSGTNPNILSELEWEDLKIYQVHAGGRLLVGRTDVPWFMTAVKGYVNYGWIHDGENQDSDYGGNDRTLEWSRSNNDADGGKVIDYSIAVGMHFKVYGNQLKLTPLVGYSHHEQHLEMTNGNQTLIDPAIISQIYGIPESEIDPTLGPFSGLNSTYEARWQGAWTGLDIEFTPHTRVALAASLEYHWADFSGWGNWNLRQDFAHPTSFVHTADGTGVVVNASGQYNISQRWAVGMDLNFQEWETEEGTDRTFFANGVSLTTQLNEVNWTSTSILLKAIYTLY